jgi:hypothetical protein
MIVATINSGKSCLELEKLAAELDGYVRTAVDLCRRQYDVERDVLSQAIRIGRAAMDLYLQLQGNGDLGPTVSTAAGEELERSSEPVARPLRTVFGEHTFDAYVYAPGAKQKIVLRPIDARLQLPAGKFSYLYEEFSQYFCVEQAFGTATERLEAVLGQKTSVDSLESINRRLGEQAEEFLENLPVPPAAKEGELFVATSDGKGVPLVKADAERIPVFETRARPGNRRMATLGCVYSVDRHVRSAQDILEALFRENRDDVPRTPRPEPRFKQLVARFTRTYDDGLEQIVVPGAMEAFSWIAMQTEQRRRPGQLVIRLMDGQESLWNTADCCLSDVPPECQVDVLDIIHVAGYVWHAAKAFESSQEHREAFVWGRLERILEGDAKGVVAGLRRMATIRGLCGIARREVRDVCRYLENNLHRMRYDEYLREGYPIATGVIEGACRHLVKDRMERSGMRWTLEGAQAMLNVRSTIASSYWNEFNQFRMAADQKRLHVHAALVHDGQARVRV